MTNNDSADVRDVTGMARDYEAAVKAERRAKVRQSELMATIGEYFVKCARGEGRYKSYQHDTVFNFAVKILGREMVGADGATATVGADDTDEAGVDAGAGTDGAGDGQGEW